MNNLTLIIYLADRLPSISNLFVFFGVILIIISTIGVLAVAIYNDCNEYDKKPYPWKRTITLSLTAIPFLIVANLIPSKDTILLMAGSEIGEQVVKSPEAQELFSDIQEVIKAQLEQYKGKK